MNKPPSAHDRQRFPAELISHAVWSVVLHYLRRAVDQDGVVLDILVQGRRDNGAAKRFFEWLRHTPRVIVTDRLRSYSVAKRELLPHRSGLPTLTGGRVAT